MSELDPGGLDEALKRLGPRPSFAAFCAAAEPAFAALARSRTFVPHLERELATLARQPVAVAGVDRKPNELWVRPHGRMMLFRATSKQEGHPPTIVGHGCHRLRWIVSGHLIARRYRHAEARDPNVLDRSARLELVEERELLPGDLIRIEAWRQVVEFTAGEGVVLGLDSAPSYSTRWAYHRETLQPIAAIVADQTLAKIAFALQMLGEIGTVEDAAGLEVLLTNHSHSVRWAALRTAVQLGHPDARALVERAVSDPHPHVRNAAHAALQRSAS